MRIIPRRNYQGQIRRGMQCNMYIYDKYVCSARSRMKTKAMAKIVLGESVASDEDNV